MDQAQSDRLDSGTLMFDRRRIPRRPIAGAAMAVFSSGPGAGTVARVNLLDASWTGIGVKSPIAVPPGSSCSLVPESAMWPRQVGIVVRCESDGDGYRLGLLSRMSRAAA